MLTYSKLSLLCQSNSQFIFTFVFKKYLQQQSSKLFYTPDDQLLFQPRQISRNILQFTGQYKHNQHNFNIQFQQFALKTNYKYCVYFDRSGTTFEKKLVSSYTWQQPYVTAHILLYEGNKDQQIFPVSEYGKYHQSQQIFLLTFVLF